MIEEKEVKASFFERNKGLFVLVVSLLALVVFVVSVHNLLFSRNGVLYSQNESIHYWSTTSSVTSSTKYIPGINIGGGT